MLLLLLLLLLLSSTPMLLLLLLLLLLSSSPMLLPLWLQQLLLLLCHTLTLWLMLLLTPGVSIVLGLLSHVLRTTRVRHRYYTEVNNGQHCNSTIQQQDNNTTLHYYKITALQHYRLAIEKTKDKSTKDCKIDKV